MTAVAATPAHYRDYDTEVARFTPRQMEFLRHSDSGTKKYLLFGGALGGGKSHVLRWGTPRRLMVLYQRYGVKQLKAMICCEDYPSLKGRQLQAVQRELPAWLGRFHSAHSVYDKSFILHPRFGGGVIVFRNLDDAAKYASEEFVQISVDELTKNPYDVFTHLRTRLRWPGIPDYETQFWAATNPGGIGHSYCKQLWIDGDFPEEWTKPIDYSNAFAYIPSKAEDNPHLDQSYWNMLQTLPPALRKAFKDGSWDIFVGQAFPQFSKQIHVVEPHPVPDDAPLYMTFDWGFGAPFSIGWWYTDHDGRIIRFAEWYGWNGNPNQGLRLADTDVVRGVIEREERLSQTVRDLPARVQRFAGHDCFSKRPDYQGGGQGKTTAEVWAEHGLYLNSVKPDRALKLRQFHDRLRIPDDGSAPMLLVFSNCTQFIRTIPTLVTKENRPEEIEDAGAEDHAYDEAAQLCMVRPMAMQKPDQPKPKKTWAEEKFEADERRFAAKQAPGGLAGLIPSHDPITRSLEGDDTDGPLISRNG